MIAYDPKENEGVRLASLDLIEELREKTQIKNWEYK